MRGPDSFPRIEFNLEVVDVTGLGADAIRVMRDNFQLSVQSSEPNVAVVSVTQPIQGQQDIELILNMNLYNENGFFGTAQATIYIYATVDPWEDAIRTRHYY